MTPDLQSPGKSLLQRAWLFVKILLAIALIAFVLSKTDLAQLALLLRQVSLTWLTFSFLLFCLLTVIKTYQYYLLTGRRVAYGRVLYVVIVQNALSNFVAGGAGILSYLTMLSVDDGVGFRKVLSSFVIVKVGDLAAVWVVLFVTTTLLWSEIGVLRAPVVILLAAIMLAVGTFLAAAFLRQRFVSVVAALLSTLKLDRYQLFRGGLEFLKALADQETRSLLRALAIGMLLSLMYMAVTLAWFYANIRAYSADFPFVIVSFVNAFIQLISWIPLQVFGGLGVSETSLVYLFGVFGLPVSQIAALGIGLRLILYLFTLLVLTYLPLSALARARTRNLQR